MRHRLHAKIVSLTICFLLMANPASYVHAELSIKEDNLNILQNSLSIVEIDHEIKRTQDKQEELQQKQQRLETELQQHKKEMASHEDRAGSIVRSYYMGERNQFLRILLSSDSFRSLQIVAGYYEMIILGDQETLRAYHKKYSELMAVSTELEQSLTELEQIKQNLIYQRERVMALEEEVEKGLSSSDQRDLMEKLIVELTSYWNNVGVHEVHQYFNALAVAMENLPSYVQKEPGILSINGGTYTISITEAQLNEFLRSENEIFQDFSFEFNDDYIIASGKRDDLELAVYGHYSVIDEPENGILFHVDKLIFNQFELPDTTRTMLEQEFDLGFYPQKLMSFIKATGVSTREQTLEVTMELSLK
ncbi:hypothetical protein QPK24_17945 [Paenibacillus polygoni]|uniref:N-terminal domain of peptidoglycan hydrolase CwlO-containing protein n=1 Tax=Paenibacillus polygoni TaxID=3050112 RepID=A0ABY8X2N8_9BACL|nr:hypothetical protein [Paenibacillus polygoni]WIV18264.1 hypothetical protein QPK24_17945 [Paenibacillus polygoni]